jgi:hypothetical protein
MYLFTRQTRLAPGHFRDGMTLAVEITEKVNQITALNVGLWSSVMSPGAGTISWGAAAESLTDLEDANAKMMVDDVLMDMATRSAALTVGGVEDQVAQFLHNPAPADSNPKYVGVVQSALANGSFQRGVEVGIEIAQRGTELSGQPTAFLLGTTGPYGAVAWISSADNLKQLEDGNNAVNMNPDFIKFLDEAASSCYLPGATNQSIWQRIV